MADEASTKAPEAVAVSIEGTRKNVTVQHAFLKGEKGWRVSVDGKVATGDDGKPLFIPEETPVMFTGKPGETVKVYTPSPSKGKTLPILVNDTGEALSLSGSAILDKGEFNIVTVTKELTDLVIEKPKKGEKRGNKPTASANSPEEAITKNDDDSLVLHTQNHDYTVRAGAKLSVTAEKKTFSIDGNEPVEKARENYATGVLKPLEEKYDLSMKDGKDAAQPKKADKGKGDLAPRNPVEALKEFQKEYAEFYDKKDEKDPTKYKHGAFRGDIEKALAAAEKMVDRYGKVDEKQLEEFNKQMGIAIRRAHFPDNVKEQGAAYIGEMSGKEVGGNFKDTGLNRIQKEAALWVEQVKKQQDKKLKKSSQLEEQPGKEQAVAAGHYIKAAAEFSALAAGAANKLPVAVAGLAGEAVVALSNPEFAGQFQAIVDGLSQRADKVPGSASGEVAATTGKGGPGNKRG